MKGIKLKRSKTFNIGQSSSEQSSSKSVKNNVSTTSSLSAAAGAAASPVAASSSSSVESEAASTSTTGTNKRPVTLRRGSLLTATKAELNRILHNKTNVRGKSSDRISVSMDDIKFFDDMSSKLQGNDGVRIQRMSKTHMDLSSTVTEF